MIYLKRILILSSLVFSTHSNGEQVGIASYYGPGFHGKKTSSGERYNMYGLSMAHKTIKKGTMVKVTNLKNGRTVVVKCNDSGPYVKGRIADLSVGAKNALKMGGLAKVKLEIVK